MRHPGSVSIWTFCPNGAKAHGWIVPEYADEEIRHNRDYMPDCAIFVDGRCVQFGSFNKEDIKQFTAYVDD